jgi:hypothetical protein
MSILVDHCVPRRFLGLIRDWGYDAILLPITSLPTLATRLYSF